MSPFYMTGLVHEPWKFSSGTHFFLYDQFFYNGMQLWNGNMLVSNMRTFKLYWLELSIKETMLIDQSWFFWFTHITFEWPMIAKYSDPESFLCFLEPGMPCEGGYEEDFGWSATRASSRRTGSCMHFLSSSSNCFCHISLWISENVMLLVICSPDCLASEMFAVLRMSDCSVADEPGGEQCWLCVLVDGSRHTLSDFLYCAFRMLYNRICWSMPSLIRV